MKEVFLLFIYVFLHTALCLRTPHGSTEKESENFTYPSDFSWRFAAIDHLQSPVDIITSTAQKMDLPPLVFTAVNDNDLLCNIKNSGHGVSVYIGYSQDSVKPQLSGSLLEGKYIFENIHFHWGKEDYFGSEHFINGESFAMEGHMVMYKQEYRNISEALQWKDGVVVLTFFAKEGAKNLYFDRLLNYVPNVLNGPRYSAFAESLDPVLWFLPDIVKANKHSDYYVYPGSLTTSPFTEHVTFIILPKPLEVSHLQLKTLRQLKNHESEPVLTNRRELQPLRGRRLIRANKIKWIIKAIDNSYNYNRNIISMLDFFEDTKQNVAGDPFIWRNK